jgi:hypothetical protein
MNRTRLALATLVTSACAAVVLGQNAGNKSAGPTRNDYQLRVIEPAQGGTISGSTVRVVVNTEIPADAGDTKRDVNSMPRPDVDVFLDNDLKGTMRDAHNVLEIESVPVGTHTLILLAKNRAGEIIDRKSIDFASTAASSASTSTAPATSSADGTWTATAKPVEAPASTAMIAEPVAPARIAPAPAPMASAPITKPLLVAQATAPPAPRSESARKLPETASSGPAFLAAGAAFLLAGFLTRRFA